MNIYRYVISVIVVLSIMVTTAIAQVYPPGMVSYWKLDESEGTTVFDQVDTNDGAVNGSSWNWAIGQVAGALILEHLAGYDFVEIADAANLAITDTISLESWVYPTEFTNTYSNTILTKGIPGTWYGDYELGFYGIYNYKFFFRLNGNAINLLSNSDVMLNKWTHLVATFDGETMRLYVDGELDNSRLYSQAITSSSGDLRLGITLVNTNHLKGRIDEIAIYNRVLTEDEIRQDYIKGLNDLGYEEYEPVIDSVAFIACISERCSSDIHVTAHDPEGGVLTYDWEALDGGDIFGIGEEVEFEPMGIGPHPCPYQVKVTATSDASGLSTEETIDIHVKLAGDVDGNGVVNILDKVRVRNTFGQSGDPGWIPPDVNCDSVVSILDKVIVRNQFGQSGCACD